MTLTTDFIAELVREANQLDRQDAYQKRRMLERAVTIIRDLRKTIGIPCGPGRDALLDIHTTALAIEPGWRSDNDVRRTFLEAASMIRDLRIVLDSETEIRIAQPTR
jgi:flagellin-specific chaperone FliS